MDRSRTHQGRPPRTEPRPPPHHQEHQAPAQDHGGVRARRHRGRRGRCRPSMLRLAATGPAPHRAHGEASLPITADITAVPTVLQLLFRTARMRQPRQARRVAGANKSGATSCAPAAAPRCHHTCGDQLPFLHTVLAARSPLREQCGNGVQRQTHPGSRPCPARRSRASSALACASRLFGINVQLEHASLHWEDHVKFDDRYCAVSAANSCSLSPSTTVAFILILSVCLRW